MNRLKAASRNPLLAGAALHRYRQGGDPARDELAWIGLTLEASAMGSSIHWADEKGG